MSSGRRRAAVDPAKTAGARERILDAAQRLFAAQGFDATATKEIAREAGVPNGLIFYYFSTKEALLESLFDDRNILPELQAALDSVPQADPQEFLWTIGVRFFEATKRRQELITILLRELRSHRQTAARFKALREENIRLVASYLDEYASAGQIQPVNMQVLARVFLTGIVFNMLIDEPEDPERFVEEAVDILLQGLLPG